MKPVRAIALAYHDVIPREAPEASGFPGPDARRYKLTVEQFTAHLEAIGAALGARPVQLAEELQAHPCPLLLTFDDGGASAHHPVAGLLEERGWRGHFFVPTAFVGQPGFLTGEQMRELRRRGHLIGSHSCSHPRVMRACSGAQLRREWRDSVAALADLLGEAVTVASVPGGYYSAAVAAAAAEAGIRTLFHSAPVAAGRLEGGCLVLGRYAVMAGTSPRECAGLAGGRWWPAFRQKLLWNAKQAVKDISPGAYLRVRDFLVKR